jgi:hypothetical protein
MFYLGGRVRNGESGAGKLVAGKKNVNAKSGKGYSVLPDRVFYGFDGWEGGGVESADIGAEGLSDEATKGLVRFV